MSSISSKEQFEAWWNGPRVSEPLAERAFKKLAWDAWRAATLQSARAAENCRCSENVQMMQEQSGITNAAEPMQCGVIVGWLRADYQEDVRHEAPLFILGKNDPSSARGVTYMPLCSYMVIPDDEHVRYEYNAGGNLWIQCSRQKFEKMKLAGMLTRVLYERPQRGQQNIPENIPSAQTFREISNSSTRHFRENAETLTDCPRCGGRGTYHCPQMLGTVECECTLPAAPQQEVK